MSKVITFTALIAAACLFVRAGEPAAKHVIEQKDRQFSTTEITIKPGDSLVFTNADGVTHNVFSNSTNNAFNLKVQAPGNATAVTFAEEGTTEVRCAIHPKMKLIV